MALVLPVRLATEAAVCQWETVLEALLEVERLPCFCRASGRPGFWSSALRPGHRVTEAASAGRQRLARGSAAPTRAEPSESQPGPRCRRAGFSAMPNLSVPPPAHLDTRRECCQVLSLEPGKCGVGARFLRKLLRRDHGVPSPRSCGVDEAVTIIHIYRGGQGPQRGRSRGRHLRPELPPRGCRSVLGVPEEPL